MPGRAQTRGRLRILLSGLVLVLLAVAVLGLVFPGFFLSSGRYSASGSDPASVTEWNFVQEEQAPGDPLGCSSVSDWTTPLFHCSQSELTVRFRRDRFSLVQLADSDSQDCRFWVETEDLWLLLRVTFSSCTKPQRDSDLLHFSLSYWDQLTQRNVTSHASCLLPASAHSLPASAARSLPASARSLPALAPPLPVVALCSPDVVSVKLPAGAELKSMRTSHRGENPDWTVTETKDFVLVEFQRNKTFRMVALWFCTSLRPAVMLGISCSPSPRPNSLTRPRKPRDLHRSYSARAQQARKKHMVRPTSFWDFEEQPIELICFKDQSPQRANRLPQRANRPPQRANRLGLRRLPPRANRPPLQRANRPPQQRANRPPQQRANRPNRPPQQRANRLGLLRLPPRANRPSTPLPFTSQGFFELWGVSSMPDQLISTSAIPTTRESTSTQTTMTLTTTTTPTQTTTTDGTPVLSVTTVSVTTTSTTTTSALSSTLAPGQTKTTEGLITIIKGDTITTTGGPTTTIEGHTTTTNLVGPAATIGGLTTTGGHATTTTSPTFGVTATMGGLTARSGGLYIIGEHITTTPEGQTSTVTRTVGPTTNGGHTTTGGSTTTTERHTIPTVFRPTAKIEKHIAATTGGPTKTGKHTTTTGGQTATTTSAVGPTIIREHTNKGPTTDDGQTTTSTDGSISANGGHTTTSEGHNTTTRGPAIIIEKHATTATIVGPTNSVGEHATTTGGPTPIEKGIALAGGHSYDSFFWPYYYYNWITHCQ